MNLARRVARLMVLPIDLPYQRAIGALWLVSAVLALGFVGALAIPNVVSAVLSDGFLPSFHSLLMENKEWLERWSPSLELICEILAAIFLGHSVFAASTASLVKKRLRIMQKYLVKASVAQMTELERKIYRSYRTWQYLMLTANARTFWRRLPTLFRLIVEQSQLLQQSLFGWSKTRFILTAFFTSFPGGFYGLLGFLFVFLTCSAKLVEIYLHAMHKT